MDTGNNKHGSMMPQSSLEVTGAAGSARSPHSETSTQSATGHSRIGGLFRPIMSYTHLDKLDKQPPIPEEGSVDFTVTTKSQKVSPEPTAVSPQPVSKLGSLFRSVKSCSSLDQMDFQQQPAVVAGEKIQSSGLIMRSIKSYMVKSNMVTDRDLNVTAPVSS